MKRWQAWVLLVLVLGAAASAYFLRPVTGPARDLSLVGDASRGQYLIRLGGCVACHTDLKNNGPQFAGGEALKTPFGEFVPPNITPDKVAGIGAWTLADFSAAMSDGVGPGFMNHLYPAFPYDSYTLMSDQEIADLYAAMQAVTPVATKAPESRVIFPLSIRMSLLGWKNLFFKPQRYQPDPSRSDTWNRGRYLAYGPGHCVTCHTPRNLLGGRMDDHAFEGSSGTPGGKVPSITRERLIVREYDRATLADALKTGFSPGFDVLAHAMGEVITEETAHWTDADRDAIAAYLMGED